MTRIYRYIMICLMLAMLPTSLMARGKQEKQNLPDDVKLQWDVDNLDLYQHEPSLITLYLWTPEIEVSGARESKPAELSKGNFGYISHAEFNRRGRIVEQDNRRWYVYPVDSYVVTFDNPGKLRLQGGRYKVGLDFPVIVDDPFWGRVQSSETQVYEVPVKPLKINVKELPDIKADSEFSGAVGKFDVKVTVPPGDIYANEEALAIITVRGPGWLSDRVLPEYREAFGKNVKLKSFSENRRSYVDEGQLVSELTMECTFIPDSFEDSEIGEVRLEYFNPASGKYETTVSSPVKVKVVSIAKKMPTTDI